MKRADRKKNDFKQKVSEILDDYRYVIFAAGIIFLTVIVGIMWSVFDRAAMNDYNLNEELDGRVGEYTAEIISTQHGDSFIVAEGDLSDTELIRLQHSVLTNKGDKLPLYLVEEGVEVSTPIRYYQPGLIKRAEWVEWEEGERHEVIAFRLFNSVQPDATAISDWDIYEKESYYEDDLYVVKGKVSSFATTIDTLAQMSGLSDMIFEMNADNNQAKFDELLLHFMTPDTDFYYHSDYEGIIGQGSFYAIDEGEESTEETPEENI